MNAPSGRARPWIAAATAFVLYLGALRGGFVYDDATYVREHPGVVADAPIFTKATPPDRPELGLYRPLTTLSYRWNRLASGFDATSFHAVDLALHAACAALVVLLGRRLGLRAGAQLLAGLVFAAHPIHVEAVAWITGRAELLATVLSLAALLAWGRPDGERPLARAASAAALWFAACLAKESALPLPLAFAALDALAPGASTRRDRIVRLLPAAALLVAIVAIRVAVLGRFGPHVVAYAAPFTLDVSSRISLALATLGVAVERLFVPLDLSIYPEPRDFAARSAIVLGALSLAAVATLAFVSRRRACVRNEPASIAAGVALFGAAILPFLHLVPIGSFLADRFLYLPSAGFAIVVAACVLPRGAVRVAPRLAIAASATVALALLTVRAVPAFASERSLWEQAVRARPDSGFPAFRLGELLGDAGILASRGADEPGAIELWTRSLVNDPHHPFAALAHVRLGELAAARQDAPSAAGHYRLALAEDPRFVRALVDLATLARARPPVLADGEAKSLLERARASNPTREETDTIDRLAAEFGGS